MPKTYHYVDPDSVYTDPQTGLLRNLGGITDEAEPEATIADFRK